MKLDELKKMMDEDRLIDNSQLDNELLKIPILHGKWYYLLIDEAKLYKKYELELNKLKRDKFEYYLGKANDDIYQNKPVHYKIVKQDFEIYFEADEEVQDLLTKIFLQKTKVDLIQEFLKNVINNRGFLIRDAIAFERFKQGLN